METRFLVIALFLISLIVTTFSQAYAGERQFIRFYKVNNKEQPTRLSIRRKTAEQAGCHNFRLKARVFQLNQVGYEYCSLYAEKDCAQQSLILATKHQTKNIANDKSKDAIESIDSNNTKKSTDIESSDIESSDNKTKTELKEAVRESKLTEGLTWYPQSNNESSHKRGVKIKSWYCES